MKCSRCQAENDPASTFCDTCGARLEFNCTACGEANRAAARFCRKCGSALREPTAATTELIGADEEPRSPGHAAVSPVAPLVADGERRHLTVMFCDLVGSTDLSLRLDPEELRDVVRAYQATCTEVVSRFEGHVAQFLGDGLLVYFGYPSAHEDDAERAVRAALDILRAMGALSETLARDKGVPLAVRLGIDTGLTVVGNMGAGAKLEQLALGETPNVAARLQAIAPTNAVVISVTTERLIAGRFVCRDLGPQELKTSRPVRAYQVLAPSGARNRLEALAHRLTPLVGREQELGLLLERWEQVKDGVGQVVVLSGEAGIGKSRLLEVLKERTGETASFRLEARCSAYHRNTPFYPVVELLEGLLHWRRDDTVETRWAKLDAALAEHRIAGPEVGALLATLLSLPSGERHPPAPERHQPRPVDALSRLFLAAARLRPLLLIVEDLHWSDPSTLEFLAILVEQAPSAALFALLTARPEFRPACAPRSHLTQLMLNRLTRSQTDAMVDHVAAQKMPVAVRCLIVAKTDGVPLFIEELTKAVLESDLFQDVGDRYEMSAALPRLTVPATLQDSLMARLDRLGDVKIVAQVGATIGRTFSWELLREAALVDDATLRAALARLVDAELVYQRGEPPEATFVFKHSLIQEVAYQSLLKATRQHYHQRIAAALVAVPDVAGAEPEPIAHHYTEAGLPGLAVPYWLRAGQRAIERSANVEAVDHLTRGLDALGDVPEGPDRLRHELDLQIALGPPLMTVKGYGTPEVVRTYARALELSRQVGRDHEVFAATHGLWLHHWLRGDAGVAVELAQQIFDLAGRAGDLGLQMISHEVMGEITVYRGDFRAGRAHMERTRSARTPCGTWVIRARRSSGAMRRSRSAGRSRTRRRSCSR